MSVEELSRNRVLLLSLRLEPYFEKIYKPFLWTSLS